MLSSDDNPDKWRLLCTEHFQKPMGGDPNQRIVVAVCEAFDKDIVEFKNVEDDFHFDIPTELFYLLPNIGGQVYISRVHFLIHAHLKHTEHIVDLISGHIR